MVCQYCREYLALSKTCIKIRRHLIFLKLVNGYILWVCVLLLWELNTKYFKHVGTFLKHCVMFLHFPHNCPNTTTTTNVAGC